MGSQIDRLKKENSNILINLCMDIIDFESAYKCLSAKTESYDVSATIEVRARQNVALYLTVLFSASCSFMMKTEVGIAIIAFLCNLILIAFVYVIGVQQGYFEKYEKLIYKRMIYKDRAFDVASSEETNDESDNLPHLGFDIVTQCSDVLVHTMPKCKHKMNRDSLLEYALSAFAESTTLKLKCPHSIDGNLCNMEWDYLSIIDILQYGDKDKSEWTKYAKLELLASRNVIENELESQKCPKCQTLYVRNFRKNKKAMDEIQSVDDIENEFKFECVFCPKDSIEIVERIKVPQKKESIRYGPHFEDDVKEDIDGNAVNALFGINENEESDDDDDDIDDDDADELRTMRLISHMFDDDEPDFVDRVSYKLLNTFCFCCGDNWTDGHVCDSSFKSDLVSILSQAEKKRIDSVSDVPSIRSCPNCAQLITHTDACKHMKCSRCYKDFCFVCLKMKKNGKWQCGSYSSACPVAPPQNEDSLPNNIVITKKAFRLF